MKRMMMGVVFAVLAAMWLAACGDDTGGGRPQLANADRARFEGPCLKFAALNTYGDLISEALAIINEVIELIPPRGVEGE